MPKQMYCRLKHEVPFSGGYRLIFDIHAANDDYLSMFVVDVGQQYRDFIVRLLTAGAPAWKDERFPPPAPE